MELQEVLGNSIDSLIKNSGKDADDKMHQFAVENAEFIAKLGKQMINNADVILRTDKLCGRSDRTDVIVGEVN